MVRSVLPAAARRHDREHRAVPGCAGREGGCAFLLLRIPRAHVPLDDPDGVTISNSKHTEPPGLAKVVGRLSRMLRVGGTVVSPRRARLLRLSLRLPMHSTMIEFSGD